MEGSILNLLGMNSTKTTFSNSDLDLMEVKLRRSEEVKAATEDSLRVGQKEIRMRTFFTVEDPLCGQIVSSVETSQGGKFVSVRNPEGEIQTRIQYTREELLRFGQSPLSVLAPVAIKSIVEETPELIADLPVCHAK